MYLFLGSQQISETINHLSEKLITLYKIDNYLAIQECLGCYEAQSSKQLYPKSASGPYLK
jgi:hypothetical protein